MTEDFKMLAVTACAFLNIICIYFSRWSSILNLVYTFKGTANKEILNRQAQVLKLNGELPGKFLYNIVWIDRRLVPVKFGLCVVAEYQWRRQSSR